MQQTAFAITALPHNVWQFEETRDHFTSSFLIVGTKRAVSIDTGNIEGPLMEAYREITDLPIDVILTHGHGDHTVCNDQFERVYVHPQDMPRLVNDMQMTPKTFAAMARAYKKRTGVELPASAMKIPHYLIGAVRDGDVWDLGGRTLEIIEIPGHSAGSIAILDRENRILFTGDSVGDYVVWGQIGTRLEEHLASMKKLWARKDEYDVILPAHGPGVVDKSMIASVIACDEEILANPGIGQPYSMTVFGDDCYQYDAHGARVCYKVSRLFKRARKTAK